MAALGAEGRADRIAQRGIFGRAVDPDVGDAERSQPVQLAQEPRPVAERRVGAEPRRVPHVGAGIMIVPRPDPEPGPVAADELAMAPAAVASAEAWARHR